MPDNEEPRIKMGGRMVPALDSAINEDLDEIYRYGSPARMEQNAEVYVTATKEDGRISFEVHESQGVRSYPLADAVEEAFASSDVAPRLYLECCNYEGLRFTIACNFPATLPSRDQLVNRLRETIKKSNFIDWHWCRRQARFNRTWAIGHPAPEWNSEVEYALVLCDSVSVEEAIRTEYKEIQQERARIDAERDKWLHDEAEPFMDSLKIMLSDSSLPQLDRAELQEMLHELRRDSYYRGVISSAEAMQQLDRSDFVLRKNARKGKVGYQLGARDYVYNELDVAAFGKEDRPPGGDQRSKK